MPKLTLSLIAVAVCLAAAGCDFKEKRNGTVTLAGGANIPLNDQSGARAELVAGPAEVTFKKGSSDRNIAIRVSQPNRPEINFSADVSSDYRSGNFTLRGSQIGQPVDLISGRSYAITGPTHRYTTWEDNGFERCLVDTTWDPCDENWKVTFLSGAGAELGNFASRRAERCNERRGFPYACHRMHEPRVPDFPRGPRGQAINSLLDVAPEKVKFE